ncbi:MAG: hypothetical protein IGS38_22835 [Synechococcales cyanobacterium M58_A2018_015]|nr:hypothetical protein [Synechococcales cyanobacterium M58_A2018_015]
MLSRLIVLLMLAGLVGCSRVTTVQSVQARPQRPSFLSTVYLRGTVGDRVPLIGAQVYQLHDSTGSIWVLTTQPPLRSGDPISIRGRIRYEEIPLAGQILQEVYIEEQQRLDLQESP